MNYCTEHRETPADDSGRGEYYPDDRTELAYVYDGESLRAICFDEREVRRYREETTFHVSLTPAGECRIRGTCPGTVERKEPETSLVQRILGLFGWGQSEATA